MTAEFKSTKDQIQGDKKRMQDHRTTDPVAAAVLSSVALLNDQLDAVISRLGDIEQKLGRHQQ